MTEYFEDKLLTGKVTLDLGKAGKFSFDKQVICNHIVDIFGQYKRKGFTLTLRQLYYQLLSRAVIKNHIKVYKKIGNIKDDLMFSGNLDWSVMEDRARRPQVPYTDDSVADALDKAARMHTLPRMRGQDWYIEVWIEKDAISNIIYPICRKYGISLHINRGYNSSSAMYESYIRFIQNLRAGKKIKVLFLSDHDPSGFDMFRDIRERMKYLITKGERLRKGSLLSDVKDWCDKEFEDEDAAWAKYQDIEECFVSEKYKREKKFDPLIAYFIHHVHFERLGLTTQQVNKYSLPPNPAKTTDKRAAAYIEEYGEESWEVDALTPEVLQDIVEEGILKNLDEYQYRQMIKLEQQNREYLNNLIANL